MCVIIIKQKNKVFSEEIAASSARLNPDGLGVIWLDTFEVQHFKSKDYPILITDRPFIAHFRYATVGKVNKENTHPFMCGNRKDEWLMMNGTIAGLGNKKVCDSRVLANQIGSIPRQDWESELSKHASRFVTVNTKSRTFQIYNKHLWTQHDGIWYSKDNVLEINYIAVYGTLKKYYSNYWTYLHDDSTFIGMGKTKEKYPLVIQGLPYLIETPGVGHNVSVDIFRVTDSCMQRLDRLEGHPNFYERKQVDIIVGDKYKHTLSCWVYFNRTNTHVGQEHHRSFIQNSKWGSTYSGGTFPRAYNQNNWEDDYDFEWPKKTRDIKELPATIRDFTSDTGQLSLDHIVDADDFHALDKQLDEVNNKPVCVDCFHDLEHDGYGNYHCTGCGEWFTEKDVLYSR